MRNVVCLLVSEKVQRRIFMTPVYDYYVKNDVQSAFTILIENSKTTLFLQARQGLYVPHYMHCGYLVELCMQ